MNKAFLFLLVLLGLSLLAGAAKIPSVKATFTPLAEQTAHGSSSNLIGVHPDTLSGHAEAFNITQTLNYTLTQASFYIQSKTGSPTGNYTARLYNVTGTYGTTMKPNVTDTPYLAESQALDASQLVTTAWNNFSFSDGFILRPNTKYCIAIIHKTGFGNSTNYFLVGFSGTDTYSGNMASYSPSEWTAYDIYDLAFQMYGIEYTPPAPPPAVLQANIIGFQKRHDSGVFQAWEGNTVYFKANVSGGVSPYTYRWWWYAGDLGTSQTLNVSFSALGTTAWFWTIYCDVTDSNSTVITPIAYIWVYDGGGIHSVTVNLINNSTDAIYNWDEQVNFTCTANWNPSSSHTVYYVTDFNIWNDDATTATVFYTDSSNNNILYLNQSLSTVNPGNHTLAALVLDTYGIYEISNFVNIEVESLANFDLMVIVGLIGTFGMPVSITYAAFKMKNKEYRDGFITGVIFFSLSFGLFLAWIAA